MRSEVQWSRQKNHSSIVDASSEMPFALGAILCKACSSFVCRHVLLHPSHCVRLHQAHEPIAIRSVVSLTQEAPPPQVDSTDLPNTSCALRIVATFWH